MLIWAAAVSLPHGEFGRAGEGEGVGSKHGAELSRSRAAALPPARGSWLSDLQVARGVLVAAGSLPWLLRW